MRLCQHCNKELIQKHKESNGNFNKRKYCNIDCLKLNAIKRNCNKFVGLKFEKIYVSNYFIKNDIIFLHCICDCKNEKDYKLSTFEVKPPTHCGCFNKNSTHKMCNTKLYKSWICMRRRCNNPDELHAKYYKDKGITVCKEWNESFENFRDWAFSNGYIEGYTIERKDNSKGYSPDNCEWIPMSEQYKNKTNKSHLIIDGVDKTFTEWATENGIRENTIRMRIKYGHVGKELIKPTKKYNKENPYKKGE